MPYNGKALGRTIFPHSGMIRPESGIKAPTQCIHPAVAAYTNFRLIHTQLRASFPPRPSVPVATGTEEGIGMGPNEARASGAISDERAQ